ncbi:Gfo/Idh/MocA family protein [Paracoccus nototheniae]|uniref:Gfo/Idh/MocA family protein n=1 Tax=Paracoccus nototheniae TaxID=2489002 RepID=A0ABW4DZM5_9RHOB|nr:Gfo/Idh/MocA family oxidoreductase [Paracoccus nototheniae]
MAIVGLGMALAPHMASLADLRGRAHLAYAVARSPARRAAFDATYGMAATADLDAVLADPAVDAVILLTPPDTHHDLGARILSAGKHVLIEKPGGLVTDDTRFLADRAKALGLFAAPVLQHRFRPAVRAVAVQHAASCQCQHEWLACLNGKLGSDAQGRVDLRG